MAVLHLGEKDFDETINKGVVLVDFWATWCAPCRSLGPVIEDLGGELEGNAVVAKVDIDKEHELAVRYGVMTIPTVIIFKDGEEKERLVGVQPKKKYIETVNMY